MVDAQDEIQTEDKRLDQAEEVLGDHVTGGVVQGWRQVQRRLCVLSEGEAASWHPELGGSQSALFYRLKC